MELISILFSFEGRINRRPLWGFWLFVSVINLIVMIALYHQLLDANLSADMSSEEIEQHFSGLVWYNIFSLVMIWPSLALSIKLAHDRNHSGWYLLLLIIPLVNLWVLIELYCLSGTAGANSYGPDPLPFAKPGLGWLILLGHLIISSVQTTYAVRYFNYFMEHGRDTPPAHHAAPPLNDAPQLAPALRPSAI